MGVYRAFSVFVRLYKQLSRMEVGDHFHVNGSGTTIKYIFVGGQRIAQIKSGQILYYHQDHLGSSTAISDESGNIVQRAEYLPYGGQRSTDAMTLTNYAFTGQEKDPETGLYNYNARLYDPAIALFITADSVVPDPSSSIGYQRYGYCFNNPLAYKDPSGHHPAIVAMAVMAAVYSGLQTYGADGDFMDVYGAVMTSVAISTFSAGVFNAIGTIGDGLHLIYQAGLHTLGGAATGFAGSIASGGNMSQMMYAGAFSAGVSKLIGAYSGMERWSAGSQLLGRMALGGSVSMIYADLTDGDQLRAFMYGAAVAGVAVAYNDLKHPNFAAEKAKFLAQIALRKENLGESDVPHIVRAFGVTDRYYARENMTPEQQAEAGKQALVVVGGTAAVVGGICVAAELYPAAMTFAGTPIGQTLIYEFGLSTLFYESPVPTLPGLLGQQVGERIENYILSN